jgi:hypothetical protein
MSLKVRLHSGTNSTLLKVRLHSGTNSMLLKPSWEADSRSAIKEKSFMEPKDSLSSSQKHETDTCSEPDRFSPHLHTASLWSALIIFSC